MQESMIIICVYKVIAENVVQYEVNVFKSTKGKDFKGMSPG